MTEPHLHTLLEKIDHSLQVTDGRVQVTNPARFAETVEQLARTSVLRRGRQQALARYLVRAAAQELGIVPSSINDLYLARGRGDVPPTFTVPALNLRGLSFYAARAAFRAARKLDASAIIFEIARSEIGYTDQRPVEYAINVLAAAIAEGYRGPVFIQGDHFQVSPSRFADDPEAEMEAVRSLTTEAIAAGFYNIDVDTSTLVDLSQPTVPEQQALNYQLSADLTSYIRSLEPPGITISVGGEIGEVGGRNSTEEELRAYMDGFNAELAKKAPGVTGLSKISIQTGTSHGGVVLPDGSIAEVKVDFDTLYRLSRVAREAYGLAGTVQHGASTLPEDAFGKFAECEACEVHLATNFQTMMYERLPEDLKKEIYAYLDQHHQHERKKGWTDEQFYYKTQKRAIGPFKAQLWGLPQSKIDEICAAWEEKFTRLFEYLQVGGTHIYVERVIQPVSVPVAMDVFMAEAVEAEDTSDLAD